MVLREFNRLFLVGMFLIAVSGSDVDEQLRSLCPETFNIQKSQLFAEVRCYGLTNFTQFGNLLPESVENLTVRVIIGNCSTITMEESPFQNLSIVTLFVECPLESISDKALLGMSSLRQLTFSYILQEDLPNAVKSVPTMEVLRISQTKVRVIRQQLQHLTNIVKLFLEDNEIDFIAENAFVGLNNLNELRLSRNKLKRIFRDTFNDLVNLKVLHLDYNLLISLDGAFRFINPKVIYINNNYLSSLEKFVHHNMTNLEIFRADDNPFSSIEPETFSGDFGNLKRFGLKRANLTGIPSTLLHKMGSLRTFDLGENDIPSLHLDTFHHCRYLYRLYLENNRLETVEGILDPLDRLKRLSIGGNRIKKIGPTMIRLESLQELNMTSNFISSLNSTYFKKMRSLIRLVFRNNSLSTLPKNVFASIVTLVLLDLSDNQLQLLNGSVMNLPALRFLNISYNLLTFLSSYDFSGLSRLEYLNAEGNLLQNIDGAFQSLLNLKTLVLSGNKLSSMTDETFPAGVELLFLEGNSWRCDCLLIPLIEYIRAKNSPDLLQDNPFCNRPSRLSHSYLKNLNASDLLKITDDCPDFCRCSCSLDGPNMFITNNCSGQGLQSVPEDLSASIHYLDLSNNSIPTLEHYNFSSMPQLLSLDVRDNQITSAEGMVLPGSLRIIKLSNNRITEFPLGSVENLTFHRVNLNPNPWECNCETVKFKEWLLASVAVIEDLNDTRCAPNKENKKIGNSIITQLSDSDLCPSTTLYYVSIAVGILTSLLLLSVTAITYINYKINIKIWLYAHGFSCVKEEDLDTEKQFDAFVSYSSDDESFVSQELVPALEKDVRYGRYNLCLHYRHFPPGEYIHDNIINAVKSSKRTIMVLSKNFLKSEWCRLEFRASYVQVLKDKVHRLIIIKYGDLPPVKDMDPAIQVYLDSTTYLQWGEKYFWEKLRFALPKIPMDHPNQDHYWNIPLVFPSINPDPSHIQKNS